MQAIRNQCTQSSSTREQAQTSMIMVVMRMVSAGFNACIHDRLPGSLAQGIRPVNELFVEWSLAENRACCAIMIAVISSGNRPPKSNGGSSYEPILTIPWPMV